MSINWSSDWLNSVACACQDQELPAINTFNEGTSHFPFIADIPWNAELKTVKASKHENQVDMVEVGEK